MRLVLLVLVSLMLLALVERMDGPRALPVALESDAQLVLLRLPVRDDVSIMLGDDDLSWDQFRRLDLTTVRVEFLLLSFGKVRDIRLRRR